MEVLRICSVLSLSLALTQAYGAGYEPDKKEDATPMVAFLCGKPAMHFTPQGWVRDEKSDCLKSKEEILKYCKTMYPDMEITNYVETDHKETIENWCSFGHDRCHRHGSHTVRPFKCLVGPFQSDALLVPDHCVFDHIHQSEECKSFQGWNKTASDACLVKHKMAKQSFAILLPCGINMFGGVEYVCCPKEKKVEVKIEVKEKKLYDDKTGKTFYQSKVNKPPQVEEQQYLIDKYEKVQKWDKDWIDEDLSSEEEDEDDYSEEDSDEDYYDEEDSEEDDDWEDSWEDEDEDKLAAPPTTTTKSTTAKTTKVPAKPTDTYSEYLRGGNRYLNEHEYFVRAKSELQKHHHEKVTKMMKEWAAARQRVQEMKATDGKAADKLNREITARFQKTYEALEQEGMAEKKQLVALHQQRVQASLNEKKRHAMEHYMASLQKTAPEQATMILKSLKHYIKMEQKDRMHTINHFKHLRDTDPAEAERLRQQTRDHLAIIDQRMQQSVEMLNRVPDFAKKIKVQIDNFLASFHEIDVSIATLLEPHPIKVPSTTGQEKPVEPPTANIEVKVEHEEPSVVPADKEDEPVDNLAESVAAAVDIVKPVEVNPVQDKLPIEEEDLHHIPLTNNALKPTKYDAAEFDDEVMEDERTYIDIKPAPAHQGLNELDMKEPILVDKKPISSVNSIRTGSTLGIAVGCIAVFVIIVIGIVVLRKKAGRVPVSHGFVEVDQAASPEERHVANMQINGYENPTYKYFEMNGNGSA